MTQISDTFSIHGSDGNYSTGERYINITYVPKRDAYYYNIQKIVRINGKTKRLFRSVNIPYNNTNRESQLKKAIMIRNRIINEFGLELFLRPVNTVLLNEDNPMVGVTFNYKENAWIVEYKELLNDIFIPKSKYFFCINKTKEEVKEEAILFRKRKINDYIVLLIKLS